MGETFLGVRDLDTLRQGVSSPGAVALLDVPWTPFFILICFAVHMAVGVMATAGAIAIFAVAWLNERASRIGVKEITQAAPLFYGGLEADLRGAETARAMGMEPALIERRLHERVKLVSAQTRTSSWARTTARPRSSLRMLLQSATLCPRRLSRGEPADFRRCDHRSDDPHRTGVCRRSSRLSQEAGSRRSRRGWRSGSLEKALEDYAEEPSRTRLPAAGARSI